MIGYQGGMYLLRLILPDRPGSLGAVASALGAAQADISAVEIVEKGSGYAIDDFMLNLPADTRPDALLTACAQLQDVEVMWVSFYPENWGLASDMDVLEEMTASPAQAETLLADAAPTAFHCTWALIADQAGAVVHATTLAPDFCEVPASFGDLSDPHVLELGAGWFPGWGEQAVAVAPFRDQHTIVIGRPGPEFRRSELVRLRHLALLAGEHDEAPGVLEARASASDALGG